MQTISTKYIGATTHRGTRYKATHTGGARSVTLGKDYALSDEQNHTAAAEALAALLNWEGQFIGGHTVEGMVFVHAAPEYTFTTTRCEVAA